ncbi:MAG: hypothetical protein K9K75_02895 [Deltaproteobacteria bacterium]|nr:hypothetical protein [Deltaproteobacteria bacterium]
MEVLIATAIGMLVIFALYGIFNSFYNTKRTTERYVSLNTDIITAISLMQSEISLAGFGNNLTQTGLLPLCHGQFLDDTAQATNAPCVGVEFASPHKIIVASDGEFTGTAERIGYDVYKSASENWNTIVLGRAVGNASHSPLIALRGADLALARYLRFSYFNENGTVATSLESIRRVKVDLSVFWKDDSRHDYTFEIATKNIGHGTM